MTLTYSVLKEAATRYFDFGWALILVKPGEKRPLIIKPAKKEPENPDEEVQEPDKWTSSNPCFPQDRAAFMAAITAQEAAGSLVPNIAVVAQPGSLIVADLDTAEEVGEFSAFLGEEVRFTVKTPGMRNGDGGWKHKDGGHIYYSVAGDEELAAAVATLGATEKIGGAAIMLRSAYCLLPPSERDEGAYVRVGEPKVIPPKLRAALIEKARAEKEKKEKKETRTPAAGMQPGGVDPAEAAWKKDHSWSDFLTEDRWTEVGTEACGCPTWLRPSGTGDKSAVAHEGCEYGDFLHLFTTTYIGAVGNAAEKHGPSLTKVQVAAHVYHGGEIQEVFREIERDYNDGYGLGMARGFGNIEPRSSAVPALPAVLDAEEEDQESAAVDHSGEYAERLAAWVGEAEGDLGRTLTEEQIAALAARFYGPNGGRPRLELAPGKERTGSYGCAEPMVSAAEMVEIFNFSDIMRQILWDFIDSRAVGSPLVACVAQMLKAARRVPPAVSTSPHGGHQPISTYAVVVGRSGTGKTSAKSAPVLVDKGFDDPAAERDVAFSPATPHAIAERLFEDRKVPGSENDEDGARYERVLRDPAVTALEIGELSQLLEGSAKATGHGGGLLPALAAAWSGENFATSSKGGGIVSLPTDGHYTVTLLAGIQPRKAGPLVDTTSLGLRQRVLMLPANAPTRCVLTEDDIPRPGVKTTRLPVPVAPAQAFPEKPAPVSPGHSFPSPTQLTPQVPKSFTWCAEMNDAFKAAQELADVDYPSEEEIMASQSFPLRFRIAAICAAMNGTYDISAKMWEWAGVWIRISERCGGWIEHELADAAAEASREIGKQRGISSHAARGAEAAEADAELARLREVISAAVKKKGFASASDLRAGYSRGRLAGAMALVKRLVSAGQLVETVEVGGNSRPVARWRLAAS